jgi:hypothetical protein
LPFAVVPFEHIENGFRLGVRHRYRRA